MEEPSLELHALDAGLTVVLEMRVYHIEVVPTTATVVAITSYGATPTSSAEAQSSALVKATTRFFAICDDG